MGPHASPATELEAALSYKLALKATGSKAVSPRPLDSRPKDFCEYNPSPLHPVDGPAL